VSDLGELLGRWHDWRKGFSHERTYARSRLTEPPDDLDLMLMRSIDAAVARLSQEQQLALQHEARAQSLGVEVFRNPHLGGGSVERTRLLVAEAQQLLLRSLRREGLLR
jgi:hypothetical protein